MDVMITIDAWNALDWYKLSHLAQNDNKIIYHKLNKFPHQLMKGDKVFSVIGSKIVSRHTFLYIETFCDDWFDDLSNKKMSAGSYLALEGASLIEYTNPISITRPKHFKYVDGTFLSEIVL